MIKYFVSKCKGKNSFELEDVVHMARQIKQGFFTFCGVEFNTGMYYILDNTANDRTLYKVSCKECIKNMKEKKNA